MNAVDTEDGGSPVLGGGSSVIGSIAGSVHTQTMGRAHKSVYANSYDPLADNNLSSENMILVNRPDFWSGNSCPNPGGFRS